MVFDLDKKETKRLYERVVLGKNDYDLRMLLEINPILALRFRKIKKAWHFEDDQSVIAMLITREYEKLYQKDRASMK